ncbi:unnamed protein product [Amoebophrya sp. A25]|nr:unnamed protein product [Amoebophrya sp. A25]|eukprot:GSA25T00025261001.1
MSKESNNKAASTMSMNQQEAPAAGEHQTGSKESESGATTPGTSGTITNTDVAAKGLPVSSFEGAAESIKAAAEEAPLSHAITLRVEKRGTEFLVKAFDYDLREWKEIRFCHLYPDLSTTTDILNGRDARPTARNLTYYGVFSTTPDVFSCGRKVTKDNIPPPGAPMNARDTTADGSCQSSSASCYELVSRFHNFALEWNS